MWRSWRSAETNVAQYRGPIMAQYVTVMVSCNNHAPFSYTVLRY